MLVGSVSWQHGEPGLGRIAVGIAQRPRVSQTPNCAKLRRSELALNCTDSPLFLLLVGGPVAAPVRVTVLHVANFHVLTWARGPRLPLSCQLTGPAGSVEPP